MFKISKVISAQKADGVYALQFIYMIERISLPLKFSQRISIDSTFTFNDIKLHAISNFINFADENCHHKITMSTSPLLIGQKVNM